MEEGPPSTPDGSSNGDPDREVDAFLVSLLTGEVRVKVDRASGRILEVRNVPLDSPPGQAYDRPT